MAAPKGNTNATKWTLESTLETIKKIEYYAEDNRIFTLGRALTCSGVHQGVWSYWKKRWADNDEVMEKIYFIDQLFINKLMEGAITKRLHCGACMFALKVNHKISDKPLKEGEKERDEKIPAHLEKELKQVEEEEKVIPLPKWAAPLPKMFTTVRPADDTPYRDMGPGIYTTYTAAECNEALTKVAAHQKLHGVWAGWVLPEEEYVREKMKMAA